MLFSRAVRQAVDNMAKYRFTVHRLWKKLLYIIQEDRPRLLYKY